MNSRVWSLTLLPPRLHFLSCIFMCPVFLFSFYCISHFYSRSLVFAAVSRVVILDTFWNRLVFFFQLLESGIEYKEHDFSNFTTLAVSCAFCYFYCSLFLSRSLSPKIDIMSHLVCVCLLFRFYPYIGLQKNLEQKTYDCGISIIRI